MSTHNICFHVKIRKIFTSRVMSLGKERQTLSYKFECSFSEEIK